MFTELRVVTSAAWLARDLQAGTALPVVHDLGLDAPPDTSGTAWWSGHPFIARLMVTPGVARPALTSPGPGWLASVPTELVGRDVWACRLVDVYSQAAWVPRGRGVFAKPAEIKVGGVPASVYHGPAAFLAVAGRYLAAESWVVLSEVVTFVAEYRCFIAHRRVVAASAYLVDGVVWDAWEDAAGAPDPSEAVVFAQMVVDQVAGPAGWVLDVGRLEDGSWAVVEANAAWSANPYHSDPRGVVVAVLASQDGSSGPGWEWASDPALSRHARPLPSRM